MYYQTANTAVTFLTSRTDAAAHEMSETTYFQECARAEARAQRRSPMQRLHAALAAFRALNRAMPGRATGASRADMAALLRCDPHLLQDMGIAKTPFGGLVLETPEGQGSDLRSPLPVAKPAPQPAGARRAAAFPALVPA